MVQTSKRPVSPDMERMLQTEFKVLDKGFIRVVDYMGNDAAIEQAARVSYGTGTKGKSDLGGLINYLMEHQHSTPFEMCSIKLHVKLPVFVARQWIRHRTASVNEYSARYSILDKEFYIPDIAQLLPQSLANGQGRREDGTTDEEWYDFQVDARNTIGDRSADAYEAYRALLATDEDGKDQGIARELARMVVPPNVYTQWYWKVNLHNYMNFLRLRADPHAQWEIRQYAKVMVHLMHAWVPFAADAWENFAFKSKSFSREEMQILRRLIRQENVAPVDHIMAPTLNDRQRAAFNAKLGLQE